MKRITTIVLFASIFAVAVGTLGLSGNVSTLMVSPASQTQESVSVLGHVEYKVLDEFGVVKVYMQNDNEVVIAGKDCAAQGLFSVNAQFGECLANHVAFTYIGIGNGSSGTVDFDNATLADNVGGSGLSDDNTGTCSDDGSNVGTVGGGDMARRNVTSVGFATIGESAVITLDTSDNPFTFDFSNATSVIDSGVFNKDYAGTIVDGKCSSGTGQTAGSAGDWNMFSRQLLNTNQGITVGSGDSLSVKWTITVG